MRTNKSCRGCQKTYPFTEEFFYRDSSQPCGLKSRCKKCYCQQNYRTKKNRIERRVRKLNKVPTYLNDLNTKAIEWHIKDFLRSDEQWKYYEVQNPGCLTTDPCGMKIKREGIYCVLYTRTSEGRKPWSLCNRTPAEIAEYYSRSGARVLHPDLNQKAKEQSDHLNR